MGICILIRSYLVFFVIPSALIVQLATQTQPFPGCPRVHWQCGAPTDAYDVEVVDSLGESEGWQKLADRGDPKLDKLLEWLYHRCVHQAPGTDVTCYEESVFFVHQWTLNTTPKWNASMVVFSVWDQQDCTVNFRLASQ